METREGGSPRGSPDAGCFLPRPGRMGWAGRQMMAANVVSRVRAPAALLMFLFPCKACPNLYANCPWDSDNHQIGFHSQGPKENTPISLSLPQTSFSLFCCSTFCQFSSLKLLRCCLPLFSSLSNYRNLLEEQQHGMREMVVCQGHQALLIPKVTVLSRQSFESFYEQ